MRHLLAVSAAALMVLGVAHAAPRNVTGFTKVSASAGVDVEVAVGPSFSVDVTGRDADRVITRVNGDRLEVHFQSGFALRGRNALVRITMPRVDGLYASSGADLVATGVNGGDISLASSSGADLRVSGTCANFDADASSGADIHAQNLRCTTGAVDVSSGADARVFASGRLDVDASSGGGVQAHGNPDVGNVSLSSGGSLRRVN